MLVALMSVKEHEHPLIAEVSLSKPFLAQTVNLRVSKNVSHALQVDNHQVTLSDLPREMAECLCDQRLVCILTYSVGPPGIVVILLILSLNEVFSIVVFEWS